MLALLRWLQCPHFGPLTRSPFYFMVSCLWPKPNSAFCMDLLSVHLCELKSCAVLTQLTFVEIFV